MLQLLDSRSVGSVVTIANHATGFFQAGKFAESRAALGAKRDIFTVPICQYQKCWHANLLRPMGVLYMEADDAETFLKLAWREFRSEAGIRRDLTLAAASSIFKKGKMRSPNY